MAISLGREIYNIIYLIGILDNMFKNNKNKGYAILFTMVIVSAVSLIAAGLSSTSYKQLLLSSLVRDSQTAFYNADTASECALYSYFVEISSMTDGGSFTCGKNGNNESIFNIAVNSPNYSLMPEDENIKDPCSRIEITEGPSIINPTKTNVKMRSKGYNICDIDNPRSVEREIEVNFEFDN